MDTLSYKTISANKATVTKEWVIVDATDQVLGRLGAKVAKLLRGKYKPNFTPHVDCGDNVIIMEYLIFSCILDFLETKIHYILMIWYSKAVSYTHLDVYKRQVIIGCRPRRLKL